MNILVQFYYELFMKSAALSAKFKIGSSFRLFYLLRLREG